MLLQLEPGSDKFKFISDIMAHWNEIIDTIIFTNLISAMQ